MIHKCIMIVFHDVNFALATLKDPLGLDTKG